MRKSIFLWSTIVSISLGIISLGLFFVLNSQQPYEDEIISKASASFEKDLKAFLQGSGVSMKKLRKNSEHVDILDLTADSLNAFAMELVLHDNFLKGVVLFTDDLSYVFIRDNKTWVTTFSKNQPDSLIDWQRLNNKLEVVSEWTDTYSFFMDKENLQSIRQTTKDENKVVWKAAKSQVPGTRELLFSIFKLTTKDKRPVLAALMYKTEDLGSRFSTVLQFSNPLITIITTDNKLITPIKTTDTSSIVAYANLSTEVNKFIENWNQETEKKAKSYSFTKSDKIYWTRIDSISPQNGVKGFAVTVAKTDILNTVSRIDRMYLYVSFIFFLFGILLFVIYRLK
jgi:hypothetical protein